MVEVAFAARAGFSSGISAVDDPTFVRYLLVASFDLAESEASLGILFGAAVVLVYYLRGINKTEVELSLNNSEAPKPIIKEIKV